MARMTDKLGDALGYNIADKRIDILRRIEETGSISEAARSAKVSYKAAWQAIETLNNIAGTSLVDKAVGGSGGGGAQLTEAGHQLLKAAALFGQAREQILGQLKQETIKGLSHTGLASLGLRTSMRNNLPCIIQDIEKINHVVRLTLDLGKQTALNATITDESAQLLGLKRKQEVLALSKATGVYIAHKIEHRPGVNLLTGVVTRATSSLKGGEVSIRLTSGKHLSGIALPDNRLLTDDTVQASIPESAIVIALPH
jgi:molybdate transport system regulatory protein